MSKITIELVRTGETHDHLVPVILGISRPEAFLVEKTVTIDTTAAGGNASLMAGSQ